MRRFVQRLESVSFLSLEERLAKAILDLSLHIEKGPEPVSEIAITQQELADFIGASRESVSHVLGNWKKEDVVDLKRGHIIICRRDKLKRLVRE